MPPKSPNTKAPSRKKAHARKAPAPAKAKKSASGITAAAPTPAPKKPANRQAPKSSGEKLQLVAKTAARKVLSNPNNKPKAPKRSREEEHLTGTDDKHPPSQAYRNLMEADTFRVLSSAIIYEAPREVVTELIESDCSDVNAYGKCQLTSPDGTPRECTVTLLILASYHGSVEDVNLLLNESALIDATGDCEGCLDNAQAIHWAAASGHVSVVKALIANGATAHALTLEKWTPLHFAAQAGHLEVAQLLLSSGANVHLATDSGLAFSNFPRKGTALHYAAYGGHTQVVDLLIANQARLDTATYNKSTALHLASLMNHIGVVKALLTANADVTLEDDMHRTPLLIAAQCGFIELMKELIAKTEDVNTPGTFGQTVLVSAIPMGHVTVVLELLKYNAIVGVRCLHAAAKLDSPDIMRALLANGGVAHINALNHEKETPLHLAAFRGNLPMVEELIDNNADVNAIDNCKTAPLGAAALGGHLPVVKRLLTCTTQLSMAVYYAAQSGNLDVLEAVLGHPSANIEERSLRTEYSPPCRPLGIAVSQGHLSAVKFLLSHGANPDGGGSDESHPIHLWHRERADIQRILIDSGANVNIIDEWARSALHIAAKCNYTASAQLLLESGADVFAIDNEGKTPNKVKGISLVNDGSCERLLARWYKRRVTQQ